MLKKLSYFIKVYDARKPTVLTVAFRIVYKRVKDLIALVDFINA